MICWLLIILIYILHSGPANSIGFFVCETFFDTCDKKAKILEQLELQTKFKNKFLKNFTLKLILVGAKQFEGIFLLMYVLKTKIQIYFN